MLSKLIQKAKDAYEKSHRTHDVPPEVFQDELALKISWEPLKKGGSNFRTHKIKEIDTNKLELVPTVGLKIFVNLFLAIGVGTLSFFLFFVYENNGIPEMPMVIIPIIGLVFTAVALYMQRTQLAIRRFYKTEGYFWIGNKGPRQVYNPQTEKNFVALSSIHALQILRERVHSDKHTYKSYELNIVCKDKRRVNVTDHSNLDGIRDDANVISRFLGVPIWDGVQ